MEKNTELDQATLRLIVSGFALVYIISLAFYNVIDAHAYIPIIIYVFAFFIISFFFRWMIKIKPGNYFSRRLFAILHDYTAIAVCLVIGGEGALPIYAALLWVTLGNGMRYGSKYLAMATFIAQLTLFIIYLLNPFWQKQPFMFSMLVVTTLVVPAYAHVLLTRTRKASEDAIRANREKSRFLAQASHDLRQPIHSIGLFTACLRDAQLNEEEHRLVDNIDRSLHIVSQLFRSILDMYTLDNGKLEPNIEPTDLGKLLNDISKQNKAAARWAGAELRIRRCNHWVDTNPILLTTMVQNLVSNSLKYASGNPILVGVRPRNGKLGIYIYDKGRGIHAEHMQHVFKEFYRVNQVRDKDVEGLGLGLSIVKRISQIINLKVQLDSKPGKGTRAILDGLRVVAPKRKEINTFNSLDRLDGLRICLIDDDNNVLLATSALLEKWGCVVDLYTDGGGVKGEFDIIIADYDLGTKRSGLECITEIRELCKCEVPAMILTGHEIEKIQSELNYMNIIVLSKPVRPPELRLTLAELVKELKKNE
ncbi:ATP-binding response regulator [Pantoea ananatis]|uniref:ATP-binding response regulator n=1 Tax=Pantoea ananas TaxID=553 RepID=UPI000DA6C666|nr:hybrid sensor histidine kinase/response regulator [Pantoea ananatis]PZD66890.1 hybrid sensor histidine kinase/response regulator [Pantoea ananatis]